MVADKSKKMNAAPFTNTEDLSVQAITRMIEQRDIANESFQLGLATRHINGTVNSMNNYYATKFNVERFSQLDFNRMFEDGLKMLEEADKKPKPTPTQS